MRFVLLSAVCGLSDFLSHLEITVKTKVVTIVVLAIIVTIAI